MALSASILSGLINSNIQAIPGINITDAAELDRFCDAIAEAIVTHIQSAAQVSVLVTAVQPGVGTAPGTGTVT